MKNWLSDKTFFPLNQVLDPVSGWCEIRPYDSDAWKFLTAAFKCNFLLLSATIDEESLCRILGKILIC